MTLIRLLPVFLVLVAGCVNPGPIEWGRGMVNDTELDYYVTVKEGNFRYGLGEAGTWHLPARSSDYTGPDGQYRGPACGRNHGGNPQWMEIAFRDPRKGDDHIGIYRAGPIVYIGNWTGIECGHNYVFKLKSEWVIEAYEADSSWKKIRDLQQVPYDRSHWRPADWPS